MLLYQIRENTRENTKTSYKKINLKYQLQRGMKILNYVMDHLL